jgi:uncharacterized protein
MFAILLTADKSSVKLVPICLVFVVTLLAVPCFAAFPKPNGHVNDFAGVLDRAARAELETALREVEEKTTAEIALTTVSSLEGLTVEDYANRLFHAWGIGRKAIDNGVLVLIVPSERQMRIEVGYGLEPILPDGLAGEIIRTEFLPDFRDGDYQAGIRAGMKRVTAIVLAQHVLTSEERRQLESDTPPLWALIPFLGMFVAFGFFVAGLGVRTRTVVPAVVGALFGGVPFLMSFIGSFSAGMFFLGPVALAMGAFGFVKGGTSTWRDRLRPSRSSSSEPDTWISGPETTSDSSTSSGSSDSSSFSGGDSGGGGASGNW